MEELFLNPFEKWVVYGSNLASLQFGIPEKGGVSKHVCSTWTLENEKKKNDPENRGQSWSMELKSLVIFRRVSELLLIQPDFNGMSMALSNYVIMGILATPPKATPPPEIRPY